MNVDNLNLVGQPGPFGLKGGIAPELGSGVRSEDFTPPERFNEEPGGFAGESAVVSNVSLLYGMPLTHFSQQREAFWHAQEVRGFSDEPVTFVSHWHYMAPSLFTATHDGWVQGPPLS